ncbi:hypothetical protein LINPERHAP1_LOCUS29287 [Linum perenne]
MCEGLEEYTVHDLMMYDMPNWDENFIRAAFNENDEGAILSMPLTCTDKLDERVWHHERNGVYSVKSAYRLLMTVLVDRSALETEGA